MDKVIDRDRVLRKPSQISVLEAAVGAALWREPGGRRSFSHALHSQADR